MLISGLGLALLLPLRQVAIEGRLTEVIVLHQRLNQDTMGTALLHLDHLGGREGRLTPKPDPSGLGGRNPFHLPLMPEPVFKLGNRPQHVKMELATGGAGVNLLIEHHEMNPPLFQVPSHRTEMVERARETVQPGHHQGFAGADVPQALREHRPLIVRARALFLKDRLTARRRQFGELNIEVLFQGTHPGVAHTLRGTLGGQEALLTARGQTAAEFRRNIEAIKGLLDAVPATAPKLSHDVTTSQGQDLCPLHQVPMKRHENAGGVWFSHYVDGTHCKGR